MSNVTFSPSDSRHPNLESVATDIADFLFKNKSQIPMFCELMRVSTSWNVSTFKTELARWLASKVGKRSKSIAPDTQRMMDFCYTFFDTCNDSKDIKKMKGLIPEKLVEKIFSLRYMNKVVLNQGYGVVVNINNQPVKYHCSSPYSREDDSDRNRQSVDAGIWDGFIGEFAEVKFRPDAFHTKDINYLRLLATRLNNSQINYKIFLICLDDKDLTEKKLKGLNLWSAGEFTLIGREEIYHLQNPSYVA